MQFILVVLLLSVPMQDPLYFSTIWEILDPRNLVNAGLLSVPLRNLAGPEISCHFFLLIVSINFSLNSLF